MLVPIRMVFLLADTAIEEAMPDGQPEVQTDGSTDSTADSATDTAPAVKKTKKKKKSAVYYAVSFFAKIALTAAAVWVCLTYVGGVFMCHDNRAYPMIKDGDLVLSYRLDAFRQGDVAVYRHNDEVRFGRVIAFGGDTVEISGEYVSVNGYGLYDDTVYATTAEGAAITFPYTVPQDCIFVLNDYRSDNSDSRTYGAIPVSDTEGKAVFVMRRRGI